MRGTLVFILLLHLLPVLASAQIVSGKDTLYGNEWIKFDQQYFKLLVPEDGMYRITSQALSNAGVPLNQIRGEYYQLFGNGREVPIYTSSEGIFNENDFLEFYGERNRSQLDRHLFKNPDEEMMNPLYNMFTDSSAYFLTWTNKGEHRRIKQINNDLTNLPPREEYYTAELVLNLFSTHRKKQNSQGNSSSDFGATEGYSSAFANTQSFTISPNSIYSGVGTAKLHIRYSGNNGQHKQLISLNGQALVSDEFFDFEVRQLNFEIPASALTASMLLRFQGQMASTDQQRVSNIILQYPRQFNFENRTRYFFNIAASSSVKYLEISNFNLLGDTPVIYDVTNNIRLIATVKANILQFALPPSNNSRKLVLVNPASGVFKAGFPTPVNFQNFGESNAEFIIISNPGLYDDGEGKNWVQEYANYRSSSGGGNFKSIIVDIQQLYEQFAWGQNRHPLSIRNFAHFVKRNWPNPQYIFIIGKGREYNGVRTSAQLSSPANASFYVPTFGVPGSDNLLVSTNNSSSPLIPIGRIAAANTEHIKVYLGKIRQVENAFFSTRNENRLWTKKVLHLGGGDASIQGIIKSYLKDLEYEISTNSFGAEVHSYYKTSSEPIQISRSQSLLNLINSGVSIITFFGHSGANTFDFSLDSPENYDNDSKYPLFISLGCYSGQIHIPETGVSERFVFVESKGAIAFVASSSLGYVSSLRELCGEYYTQLGRNQYGQGIGKVLQEAISKIEKKGFGLSKELIQQFTLHGDPAFVLYAHEGPDYHIPKSSFRLNPAKVHVELDSFELAFSVENLGKFIPDSLEIELRRELPNKINITLLRDYIKTPAFQTGLSYKFPTMGMEAIGTNRFFVKLDPGDKISEYPKPEGELNNELSDENGISGFSTFFFANDIKPIYPSDFGIAGKTPIVLKASTSNTFAAQRGYLFEIDTSALFHSPWKQSTLILSSGGVVKWQPSAEFKSGTVYYWRVSPDSIDVSGFSWRGSSFIFLENQNDGWNQSHLYQFQQDKLIDIEITAGGRWKYLDDYKDIRIVQGTYPSIRPEIAVNNNPSRYLPWDIPLRGGVLVTVLDSVTVNPWRNMPVRTSAPWDGLYGSYNIPPWIANVEYYTFPFETRNEAGRKRVMTFLDSIVPAGNYVVFITVQEENYSYAPELWAADSLLSGGKNLFNLLEKQRARLIRQAAVNGSVPYYFIYKKDDTSFEPFEGFLPKDEISSRNFGLLGRWDKGLLETPLIGPASKWHSLHWAIDEFEPAVDEVYLDIIGIDDKSNEHVIETQVLSFDTSLQAIDAASYPYLRLRYYTKDTSSLTPPQLQYLRVQFQETPELALNPASSYSFKSDTLQQGDHLQLDILSECLKGVSEDSIEIKYSIINKQNEILPTVLRIPPLEKGGSFNSAFRYDTKLLQGAHQLFVEINPGNKPPERFRFNNIGIIDFYVKKDVSNPIAEVFFDGQRILDGDLVSTKPTIRIELRDENKFLPLNDTSLINIFLQFPEENELRRIPYSGQGVSFQPAVLSTGINRAVVEIPFVFEKDGIYQLIVQSKDASGNQSGQIDYKVSFKIIIRSSISSLINYPNPFINSTQFLYTLTGSDTPADYKLQITTVSGIIVREFSKAEIGELRPGTHFMDFKWDGTDQFGDRLAKGVYLFRFTTEDEKGNALQHFDNEVAPFNKGNVGKMVILR